VVMGKLIGYARVSFRRQDADRQVEDLLAAGVRRDDLYIDSGASGARASRPKFDKAVIAFEDGDTLVITRLDRLGRSSQNMLAFAELLRDKGAGLRVLNLGGGDVDTHTPMGSMVFMVMPALAQMELEIGRERITGSVAKRRGRRPGPGRAAPDLHGLPDPQRRPLGRVRRARGSGRPGPGHVPGYPLPTHPQPARCDVALLASSRRVKARGFPKAATRLGPAQGTANPSRVASRQS
jgi:DNA invertase Pin-like site-specific DNA recombinase